MKTWTNPTVEELEVKMTAQGEYIEWVEKLPFLPDFNISGKPGDDTIIDDEGKEEGTPS